MRIYFGRSHIIHSSKQYDMMLLIVIVSKQYSHSQQSS